MPVERRPAILNAVSVQVRLSAQVTDQGMEALARLPHLQAARLDSTSYT